MKSSDPRVKFGFFLLLMPSVALAQYSRTETITYHDDTSKWVLGQVAKVTCVAPTTALPTGCGATGVVMSETTYDATYALPLANKAFGRLQQTLTYDITSTAASGQLGTIRTVADGNDNATTFTDWKRGIPQSIKYPGTPEAPTGATQSATVHDAGWITSVMDENGHRTCYDYDPMGRVSKITYPSNAKIYPEICNEFPWNAVTIAFQQITFDEHGLPAGHWRQSRYQGNKHVNTYYDAMWRPVLEEQLDYANIAGTLSQTVKRYDASGRLVFQSYPTSNVGDFNSITQGVRTTYDALDRVTRVEQDSELGVLASTTEYLTGFQTRTTNPRTLQTTTTYMAYDTPSFNLPVTIREPEGKDTTIVRDVFGKPTALNRGGNGVIATRNYVYQADQQLCKVIEPETGATVYGYDFAGNLTKSATGLQGYGDLSDCNHSQAWASGRVVNRAYDARNRLTQLHFPDLRGNQVWTYTPDGLPSTITTWNGLGGDGPVINRYAYNKRRMLQSEEIEQPGWYGWGISYGYDANGSLATQSYPTGFLIDYAPNALGQATRAGTYATAVQYYPNGGIKQFTYGNGIVHTMTQNARQLPDNSKDGTAMDFSYRYDENGNVNQIYDHIPDLVPGSPPKYRLMQYDGLDRLTAAGSAMFGGSDHWHYFTYDALDNLKSWKHAGIKDYAEYVYDAKNQLTNIKDSTGASIIGLSYDEQGNLRNKNGKIYDFDYGNRLKSTNEEWYRYDGLGRRVLNWRATEQGVLSEYSQSGQLMYDENYRLSGRKATEYVYLAGSLVALRERNIDTNVYATKYQHTDALGSPVAVTDAAGTVIDRTDYEPYGAAINKPAYDGIGYTGHVMDGATGLTYMQQRYYDPGIGRFLSVDPVTANSGTGANFNRYWYANNNPYKFTDPDGRQSREDVRPPSVGIPFIDWLMTPADERGSQRQMMEKQFAFEVSQPQSARDVVLGIAIALSAGTGAAGGGARTLVSAEGASTAISITSGATRASPMQILVSMTAGEARTNLAGNGFKWKGSETTPGAGTMTKGNVTYKFSPTSNSTGLPSATVVVDGKRTAKLRFDEK